MIKSRTIFPSSSPFWYSLIIFFADNGNILFHILRLFVVMNVAPLRSLYVLKLIMRWDSQGSLKKRCEREIEPS